jgi:hypothetical protein
MIDGKVDKIRSVFAEVVGSAILRYETAELLLDDGTWESWPDLPIRIYIDTGQLISISWSKFDDLWIAKDLSLPFSIEGSTVRWVATAIDRINSAVGKTIRSVRLGQGEMEWGGAKVDIWTRLLIGVDDGWLEVFNALDENGYDFHPQMPPGNFARCI